MSKKKAKAKPKRKSSVDILPMFPRIIVERISKNETTKSGIYVPRLDLEETPFAFVFEPCENGDYKVGEIIMVHAHCGHDFKWDADGDSPMYLTILEPDDILARIEGTPAELKKFVANIKGAL